MGSYQNGNCQAVHHSGVRLYPWVKPWGKENTVFTTLYLYVLNGLHSECTDCIKESCTVCRARHLAARVLFVYSECVSRQCKVCGETVTFEELLLGQYVSQTIEVEDDTYKSVLIHARQRDCWFVDRNTSL
jgi:hypothetical protein